VPEYQVSIGCPWREPNANILIGVIRRELVNVPDGHTDISRVLENGSAGTVPPCASGDRENRSAGQSTQEPTDSMVRIGTQ
jgi:hypothetical protein